jgi:hypothetical protein
VPRLCEFYPGICLTTEEKARKNLSKGNKNLSQVKKNLSHSTFLSQRLVGYKIGVRFGTEMTKKRMYVDKLPLYSVCWTKGYTLNTLKTTMEKDIR